MSTDMTQAQLATAADHLLAAKMFSLASCVMLFYDIAITFGDEVERIWKQRFTGATVLWFLNRYLSPLGYIVIIVSFHDPSWSKATCQRYVLYPEILKIFTATAVGLIFILRLYSIYSKSKLILYSFSAFLVIELGIKIWAFTDGVMLQLPPGFVGCILTGRSSPGDRIIYTWVAELAFDSCVFFATLYRTLQLYRRTMIGEALSLITVIMRDGIMYFAAIFVSNLVTVLIFIFAPMDLKVINASFSTLITSLMVSRLMLNLRGEVMRRGAVISSRSASGRGDESHELSSTGFSKRDRQETTGWSQFETSIVGNLGAPIITFERENRDYYNFEGEEEDIVDPGMPPSPMYSNPPPLPPSPPSTSARSTPSYPQHYYPPSSPRTPTSPFVQSPESAFPLRKSRRAASEDGGQIASVSSSTHSEGIVPVHADYAAHRIKAVHRQRSGESADSSSTFTAVPVPASRARNSAAFLGKNPNQGAYRSKTVRRPRTSESTDSSTRGERGERRVRDRERDVVEMMQTRSLPAPLIVQVTEEVVVAGSEEQQGPRRAAPPSPSPQRSASATASQERGRWPWLAPQSWRLSRDAHQERNASGRQGLASGSSEG